MKAVAIAILVFAIVAGGAVMVRTRLQQRLVIQVNSTLRGSPAQSPADWTPEKIAKDPQGYLQWADQQAQDQITQRQARLTALAQQRADIQTRREELETHLTKAQNLHDRMQTAIRNADDEDHWPLSMAGRTFSREQAQAVIDRSQAYMDQRKSLAQGYDEAVGKVDQFAATIKKDIDDLNTLRDHLAIDLEKVRLANGLAELDQLHSTQAEVEATAKSLVGLDHNPSVPELPPAQGEHDKVDIDAMLK